MKILAKGVLIVSSLLLLSLVVTITLLNRPSEDIYLYLVCQNITTEYLDIQFLDQNNNRFDQQQFPLNTACKKSMGNRIVTGAPINSLNVIIQLYSAAGESLVTKPGSHQQNNIPWDKSGFHIDLVLNGKPPSIVFHSL